MLDAVIVAACRTPIGKFQVALATLCIGGGQGVALAVEHQTKGNSARGSAA